MMNKLLAVHVWKFLVSPNFEEVLQSVLGLLHNDAVVDDSISPLFYLDDLLFHLAD